MVFRRQQFINELPKSCTSCTLYSMHCSLPLENENLNDGLDTRRDELCSLIEITETDIDFFLNHARSNRENSLALSEMPEQKWKELHKSEVLLMDAIIKRLENTKSALQIHGLIVDTQ